MIIVIMLILVGGGVAGWRACRHFLDRERTIEIEFWKRFSKDVQQTNSFWKEQSAYNREIQNQTIQNHNANFRETLSLILILLQNQNKENLKEGEREQVEHIIKTIKGIR